jgi:hypothetical protein
MQKYNQVLLKSKDLPIRVIDWCGYSRETIHFINKVTELSSVLEKVQWPAVTKKTVPGNVLLPPVPYLLYTAHLSANFLHTFLSSLSQVLRQKTSKK